MGRRRGRQRGGPTQAFCSERGLSPQPTSLSLEIPQHVSPKGTLCGRVTLGCLQDACSELEAQGKEASSSVGPVRAVPNIQWPAEPGGRQMGSVPRQGAVLLCSLPLQRCSPKLKSPAGGGGGGGCGAAPSPLDRPEACVEHAQAKNRHPSCGARLGPPHCPAGHLQGICGEGTLPRSGCSEPAAFEGCRQQIPLCCPQSQ